MAGKIIDLERLGRYDEQIKTYIGKEVKIKKITLNGTEQDISEDKTVELTVTASSIGADVNGAADTAVSNHNQDESAHPYIQENFLGKNLLNTPNGVLQLNSNGKIPSTYLPDTIAGQVAYLGVWDVIAGTALSDTRDPAGRAYKSGDYYIASTNSKGGNGNKVPLISGAAGSEASDNYTFTDGDWLIFNGSDWDKIDNSDAVTSVAGKTGAVVLTSSDVGLGSVANKTMDSSPQNGSDNYVSSGGVYTELAKKQNTLTFDSSPSSISSNPVTSLGIYNWGKATFLPINATVNKKSFTSQSDGSRECTLTATDVGALPATTKIPSKTSELTNDSNFVTTADIVYATSAEIDALFN